MHRHDALARGFTILGLGLLVTIGTYAFASSGGMYIVATGAIVTGIVRIVRALAMPPDEQTSPSEDDERLSPSETIQIAGKKCAECETRILRDGDGKVCKRCRAIVHRRCAIDHKRMKHARRAATAYRG